MTVRSSYVLADLVRNPRRTASTLVGVVLGIGLFCGVLFFVDGLSASMTQRAVAPLAIDMQRIVTQRAGVDLELFEDVEVVTVDGGTELIVSLELRHRGRTAAHEVTIRSVAPDEWPFVPNTARLDGEPVLGDVNPFANGPARSGRNIGTVEPGATRLVVIRLRVSPGAPFEPGRIMSTVSSRESVSPIAANRPDVLGLDELTAGLAEIDGVDVAASLSIADLGSGVLHAGDRTASGPAKIFGFDEIYAAPDESIVLVAGDRSPDGAVVSVEAGRRLDIGVGDEIEVDLPDGSSLRIDVTGVADLSRTRPLFSSRRGGDLETFVYVENAVAVSSQTFADVVFPAFERAAAAGSGRLKSPPIREVDLRLDRELLDADPATAADETAAIAARVTAIADGQDYLLDNITNTLHVATDDAAAAKRLFVVLGLPGALLAAMLSAYAGNVLAEAQRREQAILRIRGASRRRLLRMLAWRTTLLTSVGAVLGLAAGYLAAAALLGRTSLDRAGAARLISSSLTGALAGFAATGAALYVTGRRSIDREIAEDRARLTARQPLWRRSRLDLIGLVVVVVVTAWAVRADRFAGTPGSVYFGRAVELDLWLLILPLTVWITGSLGLARLVTQLLRRTVPASTPSFGRVGRGLVRRSVGRRPWAIGNAVVVTSLIVALTTCLAVFTASYDAAKVDDARYANGADIRITPGPSVDREYGASDTAAFRTSGVDEVTPVVYALSNVILRSDRTSDPANLAAVDPASFAAVAPVSRATAQQLSVLADDPSSILVSADMADFLHADIGDTLHVLLARATPDQAEIDVVIAGLYERLPGFPEGADAVIDISAHTTAVPTKHPDFFLASTGRPGGRSGDAALDAAVDDLRRAVATSDVRIDTRATTLDRDQSSLAALNIAGLADLDAVFALGMATVAVAIFVFGLLLQRRREYVTLRAQGLERRRVRALILAEAAVVAACGTIGGLVVGVAMGYYFVAVLRPLFVLDPGIVVPAHSLLLSASLVVAATWISAGLGSRLVNRLDPIELLRED